MMFRCNISECSFGIDAAAVMSFQQPHLTDAKLADEIRFVAGLVAERATVVMHIGVVELLVEQDADFHQARDFVGMNMSYATPEQAGEAEPELIASHADR